MRAVVIVALLSACTATAPVNAADPRFDACGGARETVDATLAFTARDYRAHFPLMGMAPELETHEPAFAVVFAEDVSPPGVRFGGRLFPRNDAPPPEPLDRPHRSVCIYVGEPPNGDMHVYFDVDVALLLP